MAALGPVCPLATLCATFHMRPGQVWHPQGRPLWVPRRPLLCGEPRETKPEASSLRATGTSVDSILTHRSVVAVPRQGTAYVPLPDHDGVPGFQRCAEPLHLYLSAITKYASEQGPLPVYNGFSSDCFFPSDHSFAFPNRIRQLHTLPVLPAWGSTGCRRVASVSSARLPSPPHPRPRLAQSHSQTTGA